MATKQFMSQKITQGRALRLGVLGAIAIAAIAVVLTLTFWCDYSWRSPFAREDVHAADVSDVATPVAGEGGESGASGGAAPSGYGFAINVGPESGQASVAVDLPWAPAATSSDSVASAPDTESAAAASVSPGELDWFSSDGWKFLGWLVLLVAAAGLFWKIFEYLNESRKAYYKEHDKLVAGGWIPEPIAAATTVVTKTANGDAILPDQVETQQAGTTTVVTVSIEGPNRVEVDDSAIYRLTVAAGQALPVGLSIVAESKGGTAQIFRSESANDTFVVKGVAPGKVVLRLAIGTGLQPTALTIEIMPKAEPGPSKSVPLMVFGTGSHTLILVTLAVFVLLMITLSGAVDGAVVAPLIGTLIGYLFGVNSSSGGGEAKEKPAS